MDGYVSLIEDVDLEMMWSYVEREELLPAHLAFRVLKELRNAKAEIRRLEAERNMRSLRDKPP